MPFMFCAASSVVLLTATVAEFGAPSPSAARPCASAASSADTSGALPAMPAPASMSGHEVP